MDVSRMTSEQRQIALDQYPTPAWVAEAIVRSHFSDLGRSDVVVDPSCGPGRFLQAIPEEVTAFGVDVCAAMAQQAREITGREIITGDFLEIELPERPTVVLGNPPFKMTLVDRFLDKAHQLLPEEGRVGLILPAYAFQTASAVVRYSDSWSLAQEMIPRNIYPGLSKPLVFATFRKDQKRMLFGFSLYHETAYVQSLPAEQRDALIAGPQTWGSLVIDTIRSLGGVAQLKDIYEAMADQRPTNNPAWREKVRQVCQSKTRRVARGTYAIPEQAELFAA